MVSITERARLTGIINLGGGTPKSFVQQTEVSSFILKDHHQGHKYAIQITTDAPHPGGRSNAVSMDEGLVYGKLARGAHTAYVNCDATIALPILITTFANRCEVHERPQASKLHFWLRINCRSTVSTPSSSAKSK